MIKLLLYNKDGKTVNKLVLLSVGFIHNIYNFYNLKLTGDNNKFLKVINKKRFRKLRK